MLKKSLLVVVCGIVVVGCATTVSDAPEVKVLDASQKSVMVTLDAFSKGLIAEDINAIMANISEDFENSDASSKEEVKGFFQNVIDEGYLDSLEVYLEDVEIEVDGDEATAFQLDVSSSRGSASLDLWLKQEAGVWKIVDMDAI